jgi:hypothetical protein
LTRRGGRVILSVKEKQMRLSVILMACSIASFAGPIQWSGNGHFYEVVVSDADGSSRDAARNAASAMGGYLVTITSAGENDFVWNLVRQFPMISPWTGGFQVPGSPEPNGGWSWMTGEPFLYTNWAPGEPNNYRGIEDSLMFSTPPGNSSPPYDFQPTWNDVPGAFGGYVLEIGTPIPEPKPVIAMLVGFALLLRRSFMQRQQN